jgi:hypothetical protein
MARCTRVLLLTIGVFVLVAGRAAAQVHEGEIFGRVTDVTGAPLKGVVVTLQSPALQRPMTAVTTSSGTYSVPRVPIGKYRVMFVFANFKSSVREDVEITTGFNAQINATLEPSSINEVITVTVAAPIVDTKSAATGMSFNRDTLDAIPTTRDAWQVINMAPGVVLSAVNVGGARSGQQPNFAAYGQSQGQSMWNVDGATTTDMAALLSPQFYDFDSLAEVQVTTGGSDASVQTSGININFIMKSGSNVFKGSARGAWSGHQLQSTNVTRELFYGGGTTTIPLAGNPLKQIYESGLEAGGPIAQNRWWWWGAISTSHINTSVAGFFKTPAEAPSCSPVPNTYEQIEATFTCMRDDLTVLTNYTVKMNYQFNNAHRFSFLYNFSNKSNSAESASVTRPPETVHRQYTSHNPLYAGYTMRHTWIAFDRLVLDQTLEYQRGGFTLDFPNPATQYDLQPLLDVSTGTWSRSHDQYVTVRPTWEIKTDDSYFLPALFGGDHALKFGFRYRSTPWTSFGHYGGYAVAATNDVQSPTGRYAYLHRDQNTSQKLYTLSSYLHDSYGRGRLRLNLGVRWDYQNDAAGASSVVANPIIPDILTAVNFPGRDVQIAWNDIAPRLAATWDLFGTGKTVLKGSYGFYFNQGGLFSGANNPTNGTQVRYVWSDLNHDAFISRDELDLASGVVTMNSTGFDLQHPSSNQGPTDPNTINPHLKNARTIEAIAGLSHELVPNFGVDLQYVYRIYDQGNFTRTIGSTAAMFQEVAWIPTPAEAALIPPGLPTTGWTYWQVVPGTSVLPSATNRDNVPSGVNTKYHGWQITARKRLSHRWMTQSSFVWNDLRDYGSTSFSHLNEAFQFGVNRAPERYVIKLTGMLQLPWGLNLSTNTQIQEGAARILVFRLPFSVRQNVENGPANVTPVDLQVEASGTSHLPTLKLVDLALDKSFSLRGGRRIRLSLTAFNIFNVNTIRGYSSDRLDLSTSARVSSIVQPRVLRFLLSAGF